MSLLSTHVLSILSFVQHEIVPHLSGERERALGVTCGEYWFQVKLSVAAYKLSSEWQLCNT